MKKLKNSKGKGKKERRVDGRRSSILQICLFHTPFTRCIVCLWLLTLHWNTSWLCYNHWWTVKTVLFEKTARINNSVWLLCAKSGSGSVVHLKLIVLMITLGHSSSVVTITTAKQHPGKRTWASVHHSFQRQSLWRFSLRAEGYCTEPAPPSQIMVYHASIASSHAYGAVTSAPTSENTHSISRVLQLIDEFTDVFSVSVWSVALEDLQVIADLCSNLAVWIRPVETAVYYVCGFKWVILPTVCHQHALFNIILTTCSLLSYSVYSLL